MVNEYGWYPIQTLAQLGVFGVRSPEGWRKRAKKGGWDTRDIPGRGWRSGVQRIYRVPPDVQKEIDRLNPRAAGEPEPDQYASGRLAQALRSQRGTVMVNTSLLARLLDVVTLLDQGAATCVRLSAAIQAYRALRESALPEPIDVVAYLALDDQVVRSAAALGLAGARLASGPTAVDSHQLIVETL